MKWEQPPAEGSGKPYCHYINKRSGTPCKNPPMHGIDKCNVHAGGSRKMAKQNAVEQQVVAVVSDYKPDIVVDNPLTALAEVSAEVTEVKDLFAAKARALVKAGDSRYMSDVGTEQLRSEVALYERALDRCVATLATIAKLNIDERLAKVSEAQIDLVDRALTTALIQAGLNHIQQTAVRGEFAHVLRVQSRRADKPNVR
jgi:hypothetical protein